MNPFFIFGYAVLFSNVLNAIIIEDEFDYCTATDKIFYLNEYCQDDKCYDLENLIHLFSNFNDTFNSVHIRNKKKIIYSLNNQIYETECHKINKIKVPRRLSHCTTDIYVFLLKNNSIIKDGYLTKQNIIRNSTKVKICQNIFESFVTNNKKYSLIRLGNIITLNYNNITSIKKSNIIEILKKILNDKETYSLQNLALLGLYVIFLVIFIIKFKKQKLFFYLEVFKFQVCKTQIKANETKCEVNDKDQEHKGPQEPKQKSKLASFDSLLFQVEDLNNKIETKRSLNNINQRYEPMFSDLTNQNSNSLFNLDSINTNENKTRIMSKSHNILTDSGFSQRPTSSKLSGSNTLQFQTFSINENLNKDFTASQHFNRTKSNESISKSKKKSSISKNQKSKMTLRSTKGTK